MSLITDVYTRLTTYAGLVALISTRVYAVEAPANITDPYCVYMQVSSDRRYSHGGYSNLQKSRIQVSCYAPTYEASKTVAVQVIAAVESWPSVNVTIGAAFVQNEIDMFEDETGLYHTPVDFLVWYQG